MFPRGTARILVTDLDGTLVENGRSMRALLAWYRDRKDVLLAYNTARTWPSARQLMGDLELPWPDAVATGIGTEIRHGRGQRPDPVWSRRIAARWERGAIEAIAATMGKRLKLQPALAQGPYKVSFEVDDPAVGEAYFARMKEAGLWFHGMLNDNRWVDVIPFRAGKGAAAAYLRLRLGLAPSQMLATGDSENDLGMLARLGPAVAVGNSTRALLRRLDPRVYRARMPGAAGILEGLRHFGWA